MEHLDLMRPEHAYFFGFAQTDGTLSAEAGNKGRLRIEVSARDAPLLHAFADLLAVYSSVRFRDRVTNFGPSRTAVWTACDLGLRRELIQLGLPTGQKSAIIAPPTVPFSAPDYLRGVVDGDGSVGFTSTGRPFISLVTASQAIAQFFCDQALAVANAHRHTRRNKRDSVYNPMVMADPAVTLAAWLYPEGCLALERKRESARLVAEWSRPVGMRARPVAGIRRWTEQEDAEVFHGSIREVAERLRRSERSVAIRRHRLRHNGAAGNEHDIGVSGRLRPFDLADGGAAALCS